MTLINVNMAYQRMTPDNFDFLSHQDLHPEFYFSGDAIDSITEDVIYDFRKEVTKRKFSPTFHAPFFNLNLGARDRKIRRVTMERLVWALEAAHITGATQVVIHPGFGPWTHGHRLVPWLKRAEMKMNRLISHAGHLGLKLAFENIYDESPNDLLTFLERFDFPHVGICFDIGHFNVFSKVPLEKWLEALGHKILECHIHDNDGTGDQHIAIGDGNIIYDPMINWLKTLEKKPRLVLELPHKTHVIKSVNKMREWFG